MSVVRGVSSGEAVLDGAVCQGWWLFLDEENGPGRVVAGPFPDRAEARWAAATLDGECPAGTRPVFGVRRPDGAWCQAHPGIPSQMECSVRAMANTEYSIAMLY